MNLLDKFILYKITDDQKLTQSGIITEINRLLRDIKMYITKNNILVCRLIISNGIANSHGEIAPFTNYFKTASAASRRKFYEAK